MTLFRAVALCLLLAGCAGRQALDAQHWVPGHSLAEIESCMGTPAHTDRTDGAVIVQWEYKEGAATASLPLADLALLPIAVPLAVVGSIPLNGQGWCNAVVTLRDGRAVSLRYAGNNDSLSGRHAQCAVLVKECLLPPP
jgi:hypothetical protein